MSLRVIFLFLYCSLLVADTNTTKSNSDFFFIDAIHTSTSKSISDFSTFLDNSLSNMFQTKKCIDDNCSELKQELIELDKFNINEKFTDNTNKSFVRLRLTSTTKKIGENFYDIKLKAHVDLKKSKRNLQLFIDSAKENSIEQFSDSHIVDEQNNKIGINYFSPEFYTIKSKYSAGIHGLKPYLRARFQREFELDNWLIEPNQSFKYDINDNIFEENTYIYFDTKLGDDRFFRVLLSRGSSNQTDGMDYQASLVYSYKPQKNISIGLAQSFSGNTKYKYQDEYLNTIKYSNINSYITQLSWRQNIWKKWFNYEIIPAIGFQKQNNFEANYQITLLTEFYFGNI